MAAVAAAPGAARLRLRLVLLQIPTEEVAARRNADGIVVLTGAASRIPDAIELLAAERGKRLLISGVYRNTRSTEIARLTPLYSKYFSCCIDLDRSALNTFGNAIETRRWAREHNFNSLIIVTSNWHMPRAMNELAHQLPDVTLIAYPVISEKVKNEPWWQNGATARLLIGGVFQVPVRRSLASAHRPRHGLRERRT